MITLYAVWILLIVNLRLSDPGAIGIVWSVCFLYLIYESPSAHPTITPEERTYIEESIGESLVMIPHKVGMKHEKVGMKYESGKYMHW